MWSHEYLLDCRTQNLSDPEVSTDVIPLLLILSCQQQDVFYLLSQGVAQVSRAEGSISQSFWCTIQYLLALCRVCKWIRGCFKILGEGSS